MITWDAREGRSAACEATQGLSYSTELGVQRARTRSSTDLDRTSDRPKRLSKSRACMYYTGFPEIRKLNIKSDSPYCKARDVGDPTMSSHLKGCVAQYGYLRHKYRRKVGYCEEAESYHFETLSLRIPILRKGKGNCYVHVG